MRLSSMSALFGRCVKANEASAPPFLLDCSLSLINRTGAHYIAQELAMELADIVTVRRWRLLGSPLPDGILRKVCGRLMLRELRHLSARAVWRWPDPAIAGLRRVFLDPLYVLRSRLARGDVVLCHDIGPVSHPALYDRETTRMYTAAYERIRAVGPGMVFVSHASESAFSAHFGTRYRFSRVIPLYVREGAHVGPVAPVEGVCTPFFLTVGALEKRKNQLAAIRGFSASGLHAQGYGYVLCGAKGSGGDEVLALAARTPGVRVLGYVDDAQLRFLYRGATAFVLPSLLEGFGMPALEAAQFGLLPILSEDSALSEAVGGACIAVDAHDAAGIGDAMRTAVTLGTPARRRMQRALKHHATIASRARFVDAWRELMNSECRLGSGVVHPLRVERLEEHSR